MTGIIICVVLLLIGGASLWLHIASVKGAEKALLAEMERIKRVSHMEHDLGFRPCSLPGCHDCKKWENEEKVKAIEKMWSQASFRERAKMDPLYRQAVQYADAMAEKISRETGKEVVAYFLPDHGAHRLVRIQYYSYDKKGELKKAKDETIIPDEYGVDKYEHTRQALVESGAWGMLNSQGIDLKYAFGDPDFEDRARRYNV